VTKSRAELTAAVIISTVVVTFFILAVRDLLLGVAVVPSILWLLLLAFVATGNIRELGLRGYALEFLGAFSRKQVLAVRSCGDTKVLEEGFRLFGSNIVQRRIPSADLVSVNWSRGQASEMAGRDVNDWSVAVWHQRGEPPRRKVLIIGPPQPRAAAEALGYQVVRLLEDEGIVVAIGRPA